MSCEKSSNNITKILVSFPNETVEKISLLAKENGMSRSAMINYALKWYLDYKSSMDLMPKMLEALKSVEEPSIQDKEEINTK